MTAIWEHLNKSNLLASILVFVTACFLLNAFSRLYRKYTETFGLARGERSTAVQVVYGLFRVLVICGSVFGILQINGIDVSSMLAGVGLISAFIGLAVQDLLKDIVMGTRMLTDRFFDVGDVVQYGSFEGQVESFDIRSTKIRNLNDGRILTVCNRNISEITAYPERMKTTVSLMLPLPHDPAAIGAAFAGNGKQVLCLTGDGSLQMNLQELQTIKNYSLPIKLFVYNNEGYLSIKLTQRSFFNGNFVGSEKSSGIVLPDLEKLACAYGIPFRRLNNNRNASENLPEILAAPGPMIIEVMTDPFEVLGPKAASKRLPDGSMVSAPLEDLAPFLPREEFHANMFIPPIEDF